MNHHWRTMGTVASLASPASLPASAVAQVEAVHARTDATFSLYRDDSELSRIASGRLRLDDASPEVRSAYAAAVGWRERTDGAFTPHRPDGVVDLSGIVKAVAMAEAAEVLDAGDVPEWMLGVGGDLTWSGELRAPTLGVVDPADRGRLLTTVTLAAGRRALATSGSAERGEHIWLRIDLPRSPFAQVSVAADDIATADVLATAIVAGGEATLELVCDRWDVDVLTVDRRGDLRATPGMRTAIDAARAEAPRA